MSTTSLKVGIVVWLPVSSPEPMQVSDPVSLTEQATSLTEVFLSYRRADAAVWSHLARRELSRVIGRPCVFVDVASLGVGPWPASIEAALSSARVVLALIGSGPRTAR